MIVRKSAVLGLACCAAACSSVTQPPIVPPPGEAPESPIPLTVSAGRAKALVTGRVRQLTNSPIEAAKVRVGAVETETNAAGAFSLSVPLGVGTISVVASGFVPLVEEFSASGGNLELDLQLLPAGPSLLVPDAGTTVNLQNVTLDFPPGAYPDGATVTVTEFKAAELGAASGPIAFEDQSGAWLLFAQLSVQASATLQAPVTARVTLPPGVTSVAAARLGVDGRWGPTIQPRSISGSIATFELPTFSDYGFGEPTEPSWIVESSTVPAFPPRTKIATDEAMTTDMQQTIVAVLPSGYRMWIGPLSRGVPRRCTDCAGQAETSGMESEGEVSIHVPRPAVPSSDQRPRFRVRTRAAAIGVRGTAFDVGTRSCPSGTGTEYRVNVGEGTVDLTGTTTQAVTMGQTASGCADCGGPTCGRCTALARCSIHFQPNNLDENLNPLPYHATTVGGTTGIIAEVVDWNGRTLPTNQEPLLWSTSTPGVLSVTSKPNQPQTGSVTGLRYGWGDVTASLPNTNPTTTRVRSYCDTGSCQSCSNDDRSVCGFSTGGMPRVCNAEPASGLIQYAITSSTVCGAAPNIWLCGAFQTCGAGGTCCDGMGCTASNPVTWQQGVDCTE